MPESPSLTGGSGLSVRGDEIYDAFISYGHERDDEVSVKLETMLGTIGYPGYRRSRRTIFRDISRMTAAYDLRSEIEAALAQSRWLVVIASRKSLHSEWVRLEVDYWRREKSAETMLVIDFDGAIGSTQDADLSWLLADVPDTHVLELGSPTTTTRGAYRESISRTATAVAARLDEVPLAGFTRVVERRRANRRRTQRFGALALIVLLAASVAAAFVSGAAADSARRARAATLADTLAITAESLQSVNPRLGGLLAVSAYRVKPDDTTELALTNAIKTERTLPEETLVRLGGHPVTAATQVGPALVAGDDAGGVYWWAPAGNGTGPRLVDKRSSPIEAIVPYARSVLVVDAAGELEWVDAGGGTRRAARLPTQAGHYITAAAAVPGSSRLVLGYSDGSLLEADPDRGALNQPVAAASGMPIQAVAVDGHTRTAAIAAGTAVSGWRLAPDGSLPDRSAWTTPMAYPGQSPQLVSSLAVQEGTGVLAVGSFDGVVRILHLGTGKITAPPPVLQGPTHGLGRVSVIWPSDAGGQVASVGADQRARAWRGTDGASPGPGSLEGLVGLPTVLSAFRGGLVVGHFNGYLLWLHAHPGNGVTTLAQPLTVPVVAVPLGNVGGASDQVLGTLGSAGLLLATPRRLLETYRPGDRAVRSLMSVPADTVAVATLPRAGLIVIAHRDGLVTLHSVRGAGHDLPPLRLGGGISAMSAAETADGWIVAGVDGTTAVLHLATAAGKRADLATGRKIPLDQVVVLPSGRVLTLDRSSVLDTWTATAPTALRSVPLPGPALLLPVTGADLIAVAGLDDDVRLLDPATLAARGRVRALAGDVLAVAALGKRVLLAETGRGVSLLNPVTQQFVTEPQTPSIGGSLPDVVTGIVAWQGSLVGVYADGSVVRFRESPAAWIKEVCSWAGRTLTGPERARYGIGPGEVPCPRT
jgi:hypothetical protein